MAKIIAIMVAILLVACKKESQVKTLSKEVSESGKQEFTIQGTVLDGSTNNRFVNMPISFRLIHEKLNGAIATKAELGQAITNDTGGFTFSYFVQDVRGLHKSAIRLSSLQFNNLDNLEVNQNIIKKIYKSSAGSLRISVHTDDPLINGDTLYVAYTLLKDGRGNGIHIDTITSRISGFYKTVRTPPPSIGVFWGRSTEEFFYDVEQNALVRSKSIGVVIDGDPIINEVSLNY